MHLHEKRPIKRAGEAGIALRAGPSGCMAQAKQGARRRARGGRVNRVRSHGKTRQRAAESVTECEWWNVFLQGAGWVKRERPEVGPVVLNHSLLSRL